MKQLAIFVIACTLISCGAGSVTSERKAPSVKIAIAQSNKYLLKDFVGLSTPDESVNLAFKISGQISNVPVFKGMEVRSGELLAELDSRDFELQLSADQSSYEQSRSKLERIKRLLAHEAVSQQEFENAQSEFVRAKSVYENSKDILHDTKLKSPFKSLVERVYVDTYQRVQAGETIVRLVSPNSTTVEFTLPEVLLSALGDSTTLFEVRFNSYEGVVFDAQIKEYARTTSDASGFPVSLTISNTINYAIQSGMSCTITMMIAQSNSSSVTVPISAIYAPTEGGSYVWVIGSENRVELKKVELGELVGRDKIVINGGVLAGSKVVIAGVYKLQDSDIVKILNAQ
ncbi:MAG: efflux RND transporter periplasmic adaptor subunit [Rikenellaceae bacterium]